MSEPSERLWQVWGLILNAILPLLLSCWGFSFALGRGVSFFDGIQRSPVNGCLAASCNFGILAGEHVLLRHFVVPSTCHHQKVFRVIHYIPPFTHTHICICSCSCCSVTKSCPILCAPWTAAHQVPLSFTISQSLCKLMSIELVMPSNHLILCRPLLLLPSIFPSIRVFSNQSALCIKWAKYWSFSISPFNEYLGLLSFRID